MMRAGMVSTESSGDAKQIRMLSKRGESPEIPTLIQLYRVVTAECLGE